MYNNQEFDDLVVQVRNSTRNSRDRINGAFGFQLTTNSVADAQIIFKRWAKLEKVIADARDELASLRMMDANFIARNKS